MHDRVRHIIVGFIDFFHRPFARIIPTQTFRYLACGGSNTVLSIVLDSLAYNHIFHRHPFTVFGNHAITADVGAWMIAFSISFPAGFVLSRHVVFPESNLHGRKQLFRYILTTATFMMVSYLLLKFFAYTLPMINQTVRYTAICIITAVLSYISQRKFTFTIVDKGAVTSEP